MGFEREAGKPKWALKGKKGSWEAEAGFEREAGKPKRALKEKLGRQLSFISTHFHPFLPLGSRRSEL